MTPLETLLILCDLDLLIALVVVVCMSRKVKKVETGWKTNIIIESALSMEL